MSEAMASHNLNNLSTNLRQLQIRGKIIERDQDEFVIRQVELVIDTIGAGQGIIVPTINTAPLVVVTQPALPLQPTPFILSPLAASRLGTLCWGEPGTKVLRPRPIS